MQAWSRVSRWARRAFFVGLIWSLLVQVDGAVCYPAARWWPNNVNRWETAVWEWKNFELWQSYQAWRKHDHLVTPWGY